MIMLNVILSIRELFVCRSFSFHHANGVERMELLPRLLDKFDRLELLIAGLIGAVVASWWGIRWSMERLAGAPGGRSGGQFLCFAIATQAQRVCCRQQRPICSNCPGAMLPGTVCAGPEAFMPHGQSISRIEPLCLRWIIA
jgi:hypothetical protein